MDQHVSAGRAFRGALVYWNDFITKCISKRLDTENFEDYVRLVYSKHPLPAVAIADLFLRPQPSNNVTLDPRIPPYIQVLGRLGYIDAFSILRALYKYSSLHALLPAKQDASEEKNAISSSAQPVRWKRSSWAEEVMFYQVIKSVVEGTAFRDTRAALELVKMISQWMALFTVAYNALPTDMMVDMPNPQLRDEMEIARAAFVALLLRFVDNPAMVKVISKRYAKQTRRHLSRSLAGFVQTLQPAPPFVDKLEIFRTETLARLDPLTKKKQADNAAMDDLIDSTVGLENFVIPDIPISNSRAGLYVYLNALLAARPLMNDVMLLSYLQNRYQDTQTSAVDLILASFDLLANAVFRNDGQRDAHLLRSFIINKLPLLLCQICPPEFSTDSAEFCITTALNQVDTGVFPTASLMFNESQNNNPYTESVREEFCAACALHGLVQRDHLERILGEGSMSFEPTLEKSSKDKLLQDCLSDPEKIQGLVRELDKMDGNVGAVSQALIELMRHLCANKETMSLKLLCSQLAQKPQSLDILLLFERLPTILEPLCNLLDNWRYEEDQGEYQPVYEEFGAILLIVLAFVYRYNLTAADIGIQSPDSGVAKIISRAHISRQLDELTEQENGHINGWIQGLFDSETGGLGDELMSSCPPQEFYLLIASIFQNIVVAYTYGYLNDESLKSGIEYMVDTFLLPSLVPAVRFLSDFIWVEQKEQKSVIKILQLILLPSSISGEASTMLSSVKNLVARPLEQALRAYQREDPKNQDIEPLLHALKGSLPLSRRTGGAEHNELESWTSSSSSGLCGAVKHTMQSLVQWSMQPGAMPTSYTHRQVIAALNLVGPSKVLRMMLEELRQQTEAGSASVAYDVATALVCAPNVTNDTPLARAGAAEAAGSAPVLQRPLTLQEVLKSLAEDCRKLHKKDAVLAEAVVRLHRKVEAQMVMPQAPALLQAPGMPLALEADAAGVPGDGLDGSGLDMGMGGMSSVTGGLDAAGEADLFGSLDAGMDMFDGWDSMDLGGN